MITTEYGTWATIMGTLTLETDVRAVLTAQMDESSEDEIDRVAAAYRAAINAVLPDDITFAGDKFYGPADTLAGIATERVIIKTAIETIRLTDIIWQDS